MTFEGKSVLVTGGSRGIGKAISLRFADQGARRVAVSYLRNDSAAEETAEEIRKLGAEPVLLRGNLGNPGKTTALLEEAGPLDVIVSNAATGAPALPATTSNPGGAAVTASPWLIHTGCSSGSPE